MTRSPQEGAEQRRDLLPQPPQREQHRPRLAIAKQMPRQVRVDPDPVAVDRVAQSFPFPTVPVPVQRRRLVHDRIPGHQDAGEHVVIAAGAGRSTGVERFIEESNHIHGLAPERHVHPGADPGNQERIVTGSVIHGPGEPAAKPIGPLEPFLRRCLQLERHRQTGHREDPAVAEPLREVVQPVGIRLRIVIGERDDRMPRLAHGSVAGDIEPRPFFPHIARLGNCAATCWV